jgi:hypothetical protein
MSSVSGSLGVTISGITMDNRKQAAPLPHFCQSPGRAVKWRKQGDGADSFQHICLFEFVYLLFRSLESTSRTGTLFEVDFFRFWFAVFCLFLGPQVSYRAEVERQLLDGTARRFERAWGEVT